MSESGAMIQATTAMSAGETAASAQAAQAQAMVLASFTMAERRPRNLMDVRSKLLADCQRPRFAEAALYNIPFTKWNPKTRRKEPAPVIDFSIRFAEDAILRLGNIAVHTPIVFDDDDKQIVSVLVLDLESNVAYTQDITIEKVVEKKWLADNQKPLRTRQNSFGDNVFLVRATEQEVARKVAAEKSKAIRTGVMRLLPADIKEECRDMIDLTKRNADAKDPNAAVKRIVDGYAGLGIMASQLEDLVGHGLASIHVDELEKLRGYFQALRQNDATWKEIMECEHGEVLAEGEVEDSRVTELRASVQERLKKNKTKSKASARKRKPKAKPAEAAAPPAEKSAPAVAPEKSAPRDVPPYDGPPEDLPREPGSDG